MLVLRELILGSSTFNDISRGVPRMSRTLLSTRLKELIKLRLINKAKPVASNHAKYTLTPAGKALSNVVFSMADWGQEWLEIDLSIDDKEADHLLWSIRRNATHLSVLPNPFIVEIALTDQPLKRQFSWLIFEENNIDLCIIDKDFNVDVQIKATAETLTKVWMGWCDFQEELKSGNLELFGETKYTSIAHEWLGRSRVASIKKQPKELLISSK